MATRLTLLLAITLSVVIFIPKTTKASGSYDNASIANIAMGYVGKSGTVACSDAGKTGGDQCKQFANCIVRIASGHTQWPVPGYQSGFANAGGTQETSANAVKGDIIQVGNSDNDNPLHTAIVVTNYGKGKFNVVDANWNYDGKVTQHDYTPPSAAEFWRMGTDKSSTTPTVTPTTPVPSPPAIYRNSLVWYATTLWEFQGHGLSTTKALTGYDPPTWMGIGDCNDDGVDDIYWYQSGTIYCILGPSFTYAKPLRGPGIGPPVWAVVGDFIGSGYRDSIAWFDGATIWLFGGPGLATLSGTPGYGTPQWTGAGDYNHLHRDGIFWYQNGTIYFLQSDGSGFPSPANAQSLRGPGIGAPTWAGTGDFTGSHYRDSIAWYSGGILWLLGGQGLATISGKSGYTPPTWAGVGDYDQDGKDDIFWYIGGTNGTIYVLTSNGITFPGANGIRGPGIGAPQWAGVGYFG